MVYSYISLLNEVKFFLFFLFSLWLEFFFLRWLQKRSQTKMQETLFFMNVLKPSWALKIMVAYVYLLSISWEDSCQIVTTISGISFILYLYFSYSFPQFSCYTLLWNWTLHVFQICCVKHAYEGYVGGCSSRTEAQGNNFGMCKGIWRYLISILMIPKRSLLKFLVKKQSRVRFCFPFVCPDSLVLLFICYWPWMTPYLRKLDTLSTCYSSEGYFSL